jgi:hypothetical protein
LQWCLEEFFMANTVYDVVCDALSRIVSRRAAENIVREALRTTQATPESVSLIEMQILLKSSVFARLQQIIPVAQAKGEIRQILTRLDTAFGQQKQLPPEIEEGWSALREEFRRLSRTDSQRAQRLAQNIAQLPDSSDPVRMLNDLWAELDLVQIELSGGSVDSFVKPSERPGDNVVLMASGEYPAVTPLLPLANDLPTAFPPAPKPVPQEPLPQEPLPQEPLPQEPVQLNLDHINEDLTITIDDLVPPIIEPPAPAPKPAPVHDTAPLLQTGVGTTITQEMSPPAITVVLENLEPAIMPPAAAIAKAPPKRAGPTRDAVQIATNDEREALLTRFASEEGVVGVLLSTRTGEVLAQRLTSGSPNHLAAVVAATMLLLQKRRGLRVFYANLETVSAFIAPLENALVTVLTSAQVNVGRVFTELESLKEPA